MNLDTALAAVVSAVVDRMTDRVRLMVTAAEAKGRREAFAEAQDRWDRITFTGDFALWLRKKAAGE